MTEAEYEQAVLATVSCMKQGGLRVSELRREGSRLVFEYGGAATLAETQPQVATYQGCYERYQREIDLAWAWQNRPSEQELDEAREEMKRCLVDGGFAIEGDLPSNVITLLPSDPVAFDKCATAIQGKYGFLP